MSTHLCFAWSKIFTLLQEEGNDMRIDFCRWTPQGMECALKASAHLQMINARYKCNTLHAQQCARKKRCWFSARLACSQPAGSVVCVCWMAFQGSHEEADQSIQVLKPQFNYFNPILTFQCNLLPAGPQSSSLRSINMSIRPSSRV